MKGEEHCPHYEKLKPIVEAIDEADVIILASPVYVYHATGAMKALLDHYGWRWMAHCPEEKMFKKQGVCIATAAGAVAGAATQQPAQPESSATPTVEEVTAEPTDVTAQATPTTKKCPKCNYDNGPDSKFCANCGNQL